jgi:hypothetical protein
MNWYRRSALSWCRRGYCPLGTVVRGTGRGLAAAAIGVVLADIRDVADMLRCAGLVRRGDGIRKAARDDQEQAWPDGAQGKSPLLG